jgi:hypothetical protein
MSKIGKNMRISAILAKSLTLAIGFLLAVAAGNPAQAKPLNLTLQGTPGLMSDFIEVKYDASSRTLTARGFAEELFASAGEAEAIVGGTFEISASISNSGAISSGSLIIAGKVPSLGIAQGTLLSGDFTALGYGDDTGALELQFSASGGSLADRFGPTLGVILAQSGFKGDFTRNFGNNAAGVASIGW